jgi:hypothetical protein
MTKSAKPAKRKPAGCRDRKMRKVMGEYKSGALRSGGKAPVRSRAQAIAIGMSESRSACAHSRRRRRKRK